MGLSTSSYQFAFLRIICGLALAITGLPILYRYGQNMLELNYLGASYLFNFAVLTASCLLNFAISLGYRRKLIACTQLLLLIIFIVANSILFDEAVLHNSLRTLTALLGFTIAFLPNIFLYLIFALTPKGEPWSIHRSSNPWRTSAIPAYIALLGVCMCYALALSLNQPSRILNLELIAMHFFLLGPFLYKPTMYNEKPILFFDGVCGLCNGFVDFVFAEDLKNNFLVAALQGNTARKNLDSDEINNLNTLVVYYKGTKYKKSQAVLFILDSLGGFWRLFIIFKLIPNPLRDFGYDFIAGSRYTWFGKSDSCRLPTVDERERFLD